MTANEHTWRRALWLCCGALALVGSVSLWLGVDDRGAPVTKLTADAAYYYAYLPSALLDADLELDNQYEVTQNWYRLGRTPTGRAGNVFGVGPAVFQAPAFLVGHGLAIAAGDRRDGFSRWELALALWTSLLFVIGAVIAAARLARRRLASSAASVAGPMLALFAGSAWYYAVRQPGYAHPFAMCCVAWLVERWDASYDGQAPRSLRTWLAMGLLFGAAVLARPQMLLWGALLGAALVDDVRRREGRPLGPVLGRALAGGCAALAVFSPQMVAWQILYGSAWVVPQGPGFMRWDDVAWVETLFSSRNGLFPWAPACLLFLAGVFSLPGRRLPWMLTAGLLVQAIVNGAAWDWWGGGSFGARRFDSCYVVFALGAAALLDKLWATIAAARRARAPLRNAGAAAAAAALATLGVAAAAQLALAYRTSVTSARIFGRTSAAEVWRKSSPPGVIAAWLSHAATLPARAAFALRHKTSLDAYDSLVGTHLLGETYPGLNSYPDKTRDVISFRAVRAPRFEGLRALSPTRAELVDSTARIYVGLNRKDSIRVSLTAFGHGALTLRWDAAIVAERVIDGPTAIEAELGVPARGAHWLTIEAPAATQISEPVLEASPR